MKLKMGIVITIVLSISAFLFTPAKPIQAQGWTQGQQVVSGANTGLPETSMKNVIVNILKWLLSLVFLLTVFAFVASGIIFIMSFNNHSMVTTAKDWLTYAVIGLVVSVLGFIIVLAISRMLLGQSPSGRSGGSGQGGFWGNIWFNDDNGNGIQINRDPDGNINASGTLGNFDFSVPIPVPGGGASSTPSNGGSGTWINPDTGNVYDYNNNR